MPTFFVRATVFPVCIDGMAVSGVSYHRSRRPDDSVTNMDPHVHTCRQHEAVHRHVCNATICGTHIRVASMIALDLSACSSHSDTRQVDVVCNMCGTHMCSEYLHVPHSILA